MIAGLFMTASGSYAQPPSGAGAPPSPVRADRVRIQKTEKLAVAFVGTIQPFRTSSVSASVEGLVEQFLVDEGDYVDKNAVVAKLRTIDLEIDMKRAQTDFELLTLEKEELELSAPREIEKARAEKGAAEAQLRFAADQLARTHRLLRDSPDVVTQQELDAAISAEASARETYNAKVAVHELASGGLWQKRIAQAQAKVKTQQRSIELLQDELEQHIIRAPFTGYVTKEFVEVGQWVDKGGTVAEVIDIDQVDLEVPILEAYLPNLRVGLEASVEVDTYPDRLFQGTIALIVPTADLQSRSFPVKIRIQNRPQEFPADAAPNPSPAMQLKPGMFARAALPVGSSQDLILIHKDAIILERDRKSVFVIQQESDTTTVDEGMVRNVPIRLGVSYGEFIEVTGDLQPGDMVVTEGNERLNDGRKVRIVNFKDLVTGSAAGDPSRQTRAR